MYGLDQQKTVVLIVMSTLVATVTCQFDSSEIHGYHFHTYFYQEDIESTAEAKVFWDAIQSEIDTGNLGSCRLNHFNTEPVGPHPVGSFETCCNSTSTSQALSWFMQNRGNLSIFLHPLTTKEMLDHTVRSGFLGKSFKLKLSALDDEIPEVDMCLPIGGANSSFLNAGILIATIVMIAFRLSL